MKNLIIKNGMIAGLITAATLVLLFTLVSPDISGGQFIGYASMIIAFSTIFFAVRSHRDNDLDGTINFGSAFKIGISITLIASLIYIIAWMILSNTIASEFMVEYSQKAIEGIKNSGVSQAEIDTQISEIESFQEMYKNPLVKYGITFLEIFPVGLIISILSALILRKSD